MRHNELLTRVSALIIVLFLFPPVIIAEENAVDIPVVIVKGLEHNLASDNSGSYEDVTEIQKESPAPVMESITIQFDPDDTVGQEITSVVIHEKEGVTTNNYPLSFAIPFPKKKVTAGVVVEHEGVDLVTQFDVKRSWADGSVKHGILSIVIPRVDARGTETLIIKSASLNSSAGAMNKVAILETDVESIISLTNLSGSNNPDSASISLRTEINNASSLEYWMQDPVCTEILEDALLTPNNNLHARWEVRFYPGTSFGLRVSNSVESVDLNSLGMSTYDVTIAQGNISPQQVYSFKNYSHSYGARWRKIFWLGNKPPEVELHYDTDYLVTTKMIMPFDTSIPADQNIIDKMYSVFMKKHSVSSTYPLGVRGGRDIDGAGNIYRPFPMTGGRDELGLLPTWHAVYLLSYDNKSREMVLRNGDIAGQVGSAHYREGERTKEFYNKAAVSLNDRPDISLWSLTNTPQAIGETPNNPNSWNPDRAHQGSFAYLPYLITGEYYYLEEMMFWASYDLAYNAYGRQGKGSGQDFSASFLEGAGAGIIYDEMRAVAWAMRNVSDAVNILPDTELTVADYFKGRLNNTLAWLYMGNTNASHGLHALRVPREPYWNNNPKYKVLIAPWMHDFNIIVMSDMIRKEEAVNHLNELIALRDRLGQFTIGRFTNHPGFNKWDGAGYWWPLKKPDGDYFISGSWSDYYRHFLAHNDEDSAHHQDAVPHTDFSYYASSPNFP